MGNELGRSSSRFCLVQWDQINLKFNEMQSQKNQLKRNRESQKKQSEIPKVIGCVICSVHCNKGKMILDHPSQTNQSDERGNGAINSWMIKGRSTPQSDFNCSLGLYFQTHHASRWPNHTGTRWTVRSSRRRRPLQSHIIPSIPDAASGSWWNKLIIPRRLL